MLADHMERTAAATSPASAAADSPAPTSARSRKPWVFLALDLILAGIYIGVAPLAHSADGRFEAGTVTLGVALGLAGIGIAVRRPWGWWLSVIGCSVVLLGALLLLVLLSSSIGILWGTFGALGKATASMALIMIALIVELYVLVPAFQLWYLLSAQGRRVAGRGA